MAWNIGSVGTGFWSEKHLQAWSRVPNAEVAALCNRSRDKMADKGRRYGVPKSRQYASLGGMLAASDIDIVDIVTGPETYLGFVEQAARMVCAVKDAGMRLMVTENWRWLAIFQTIKRMLDSGELGRVMASQRRPLRRGQRRYGAGRARRREKE